MSSAPLTGGCACGAVRYESGSGAEFSLHCHCRACQRASGTGHGSSIVVPLETFSLTGALSFYDQQSDRGTIVSRGFCPICGSPVLNKNSGYPEKRYIHAGSLDDPGAFKPDAVVFPESAQPWDYICPDPV